MSRLGLVLASAALCCTLPLLGPLLLVVGAICFTVSALACSAALLSLLATAVSLTGWLLTGFWPSVWPLGALNATTGCADKAESTEEAQTPQLGSRQLWTPTGATASHIADTDDTTDQVRHAATATCVHVPSYPHDPAYGHNSTMTSTSSDGAASTQGGESLRSTCSSSCAITSSTSDDASQSSFATDDDEDRGPDELEESAFMARYGLVRCTVVRELGVGALGRVELVSVRLGDGVTTRLAARKTELRTGASVDLSFANELVGLRTGAGCPHAVQLLAHKTYDDRHEILMELAEGGTLEQELNECLAARKASKRLSCTILSEARIKEVARQLLQGIAEFHSKQLVHMDIKPANVLRRRCGQLLIGDFDCMQRQDAAGNIKACAGTLGFMAPEVRAACQGTATQRSDNLDVYSIGAVLAACAAYPDDDSCALSAYLAGQRPLPSYVPKELRDFIGQLVAADAQLRPTAAAALQHSYLAASQPTGQPSPPRPQSMPASADKRRRRAAGKTQASVMAAIPGWN